MLTKIGTIQNEVQMDFAEDTRIVIFSFSFYLNTAVLHLLAGFLQNTDHINTCAASHPHQQHLHRTGALVVGKSKSMDMHLTGRFMDAEEAERSGLVSRVVPAKSLMEEAQSAASKIAEKSMLATFAVKEAVNRAYETTLSEGLLAERRLFHSLFATEDQKEGMAAFLEKRTAQFRDR